MKIKSKRERDEAISLRMYMEMLADQQRRHDMKSKKKTTRDESIGRRVSMEAERLVVGLRLELARRVDQLAEETRQHRQQVEELVRIHGFRTTAAKVELSAISAERDSLRERLNTALLVVGSLVCESVEAAK